MISFGELRRKSVEWQTEISTVEKIYARDWLLSGIFDRPALRDHLVLRGPSALAGAYFPDYLRVEDIDFARSTALDDPTLEQELHAAASNAAQASGLQFRVSQFKTSEARVEFTGPLGRRSAAQPLIVARFLAIPPRTDPITSLLIHPFSDTLDAYVRTLSLSELTAERIVMYAQKPRARDVYDLWFILTHPRTEANPTLILELARTIAAEKRVTLRTALDPAYAPMLERAWDKALKNIRHHPPYAQTQTDITKHIQAWQ